MVRAKDYALCVVQRVNNFMLYFTPPQLAKSGAPVLAEMERDKDYALYIAQRVDKFMLYFTLAGYTLAIVLIFAIGANKQTTTLTFA